MNQDQENEIVNNNAEATMKQLTAGGKVVKAVVTVVLFKGGENFNISTLIDSTPESEEEANRQEGGVLMATADILENYIHERGLCTDCNEKEKGVH